MGQGAATAIHPKAEEHPQAYQPATQPRAPPPRAQPPTLVPVTLRPEAWSGSKMNQPPKE